jgi:hypothetical protein
MSLSAYTVLTILAIICTYAAQRFALSQGRKPLPWMIAAITFGPFALIPLALLAKYSHA